MLLHRTRRVLATSLFAIAGLGLSACASGASSEYCTVMDVRSAPLASTAYTAYIATETPEAWATPRLELITEAGAPTDDLADEHQLWVDYLTAVAAIEPSDVNQVFELSTDDVETARETLFDYWNSTC